MVRAIATDVGKSVGATEILSVLAAASRSTSASTRSLRAAREGKYCSRIGGKPCHSSARETLARASGGSSVSIATTSAALRASSASITWGRKPSRRKRSSASANLIRNGTAS
jgi:hypothetical protein